MKKLLLTTILLTSSNSFAIESPFPAHVLSIKSDCKYPSYMTMHADKNGQHFESKLQKHGIGSVSKGFGTEVILIKKIDFHVLGSYCSVSINQSYNRSITTVYFPGGKCFIRNCNSLVKVMPR